MRNLAKLFNKLTDTEIKHGERWYLAANEYCQFLADKYGLSMEQVCGIVSALSPACSWERNKLEAEYLILSNLEGYDLEPFRFTSYGNNVVKAQRIYAGEKDLFNPINYCTIDRHAIFAATGEYPFKGLTLKQYEVIATHYKKAALKLGILPCQFQAMIWVVVKNNLI